MNFVTLHKLDPKFFSLLFRLFKQKLLPTFTLWETHICYDTTQPIMQQVNNQISTGRYKIYGHKPFGYVSLNNKAFQGSVGKQTTFFKNHRKGSLNFKTLYFGSRFKNSTSAIFYTKSNERKKKRNHVALAQSRIEVRYNFVAFKKQNKKLQNEWKDIFSHYLTSSADCLLTKLFLQGLMENVSFLTKKTC